MQRATIVGKNLKRFVLSILVLAVVAPGTALAFYKPSRVIAPWLFGVECMQNGICIDDQSRLPEAEMLTREAITFVNTRIGKISAVPRIIFCSTKECADRFGQYHAAAYCVGTFGIVIRTKGWKKHFVRHELIHHLQNERYGSAFAYFNMPNWYKEGMAYSLSEDPRRPIPQAELESYRRDFDQWHSQRSLWIGKKEL